MNTETPIKSYIGYVRLITDVIGGYYRSHKVKSWFSKEVEKYVHKCFFLMDHHSLMFFSGYAIFKIYFHKISKNTTLKGISPHCYKKDYHSLFPTV